MKMNNFKYKISNCAIKFSLALQAMRWNIMLVSARFAGKRRVTVSSKFRVTPKLCSYVISSKLG